MQTWVSENRLGGDEEHYTEIIPAQMTILTTSNDENISNNNTIAMYYVNSVTDLSRPKLSLKYVEHLCISDITLALGITQLFNLSYP